MGGLLRKNTKDYVVPRHLIGNLAVLNDLQKEIRDKRINAETVAKAREALAKTKKVPVPECPAGISKKDREKIERLARKAGKKHRFPRIEYYETLMPKRIRNDKLMKSYFRERLIMEISLREGYKQCQQAL